SLDVLPADHRRRHIEGGHGVGLGRPPERPADLPQPGGPDRALGSGRGRAARQPRLRRRRASRRMSGFARADGRLQVDGLSLEDAAARFGTPLYVYSAEGVAEAYGRYARAFAAVPHRICYALKANSSGALLRLLAGLGAGADVVSGMELQAAL